MSARRIAASALLLFLLLTPRASHADPTAACLEAHADAQRAEKRGELKTARARYAECTAFECPDAVRRDCDAWRGRVDRALPSLIVRPRSPQNQTVSAKVWVDGVLIPPEKTGLSVDVDPGPRRIRVEADGFRPLEQSTVIAAGEKERVVDLQLTPSAPSVVAPPVEKRPAAASPWPWVIGGLGVVGVGVFVGVGVDARSRYDDLDARCAPRCAPSEVDGIRRSYLIADVALAVGATALVVSAVWLVTRALSTPRTPAAASPALVRF